MARARNVKPALFKNEILGVADPLLTLLFENLWCLADREGRLEDRPLRIKAETFPYREGIDVNGYLTELQRMGFILRYVVGGVALIQVVNFKKHQTPHNTEKASELPPPPLETVVACGSQTITVNSPLKNSEELEQKRSDSLNPPTDSGLLIAEPAPVPAAPAAKNRGDEYSAEFDEAWAAYPERPGASKKESFKAWGARLKAGVAAEDMIAGVRNYAAYVKAKKTEPEYIKQPATFFGPAEHFKADWTPTQPQARASPYQAKNDRSAAAAAVFGVQSELREIIDVN